MQLHPVYIHSVAAYRSSSGMERHKLEMMQKEASLHANPFFFFLFSFLMIKNKNKRCVQAFLFLCVYIQNKNKATTESYNAKWLHFDSTLHSFYPPQTTTTTHLHLHPHTLSQSVDFPRLLSARTLVVQQLWSEVMVL